MMDRTPPQSRPRESPTPDEIAARCATIRAGWSQHVRRLRATRDVVEVQPLRPTAWGVLSGRR
jgi:hypothetical protein